MAYKLKNAQQAVRWRLRHRITVGAVILAGVAIPTVAMAGGGRPHPERGPGGYPASQFQQDDGRIGLVCTDHAYSPGESTTTTSPDQPDPACRPMTHDELQRERTAPTKEAKPGESQTPTPGGPTYPSTTSTTGRPTK